MDVEPVKPKRTYTKKVKAVEENNDTKPEILPINLNTNKSNEDLSKNKLEKTEKTEAHLLNKEQFKPTNSVKNDGKILNNKPYKKKEDGPILPVNDEMLKQLANKFKKS